MPAQFPAFQNMVSFREAKDIIEDHKRYLEQIDCPPHECFIAEMEPVWTKHEKNRGLKTNYQLHWTSYKGWKVYMRHTGCFALDCKYE